MTEFRCPYITQKEIWAIADRLYAEQWGGRVCDAMLPWSVSESQYQIVLLGRTKWK